MLTSLLATKFYTLHPTLHLVARPRLTQRLDDGLQQSHRLTLVVAPAGYGKTTLVADWLSRTEMPDAMNFLLEHIPPNLRLVIVTRADPPFPLPRLRVRGEMTEIRDRD